MSETIPANTKSKKWSWITILIGLVICLAGVFSFSDDETVNDALTEAGASQIASVIASEGPSSASAVLSAAEVLDGVVKARVGDPRAISEIMQKKLSEMEVSFDFRPIISAVMNQINLAHAKSETEEQFLHKVELIARGLKNGCMTH